MIEIMICIYEGLRRIVNNIIKWLIPYCQVLLQTVNGQRHQYLRTEPLPPVDDTLKKPKKTKSTSLLLLLLHVARPAPDRIKLDGNADRGLHVQHGVAPLSRYEEQVPSFLRHLQRAVCGRSVGLYDI